MCGYLWIVEEGISEDVKVFAGAECITKELNDGVQHDEVYKEDMYNYKQAALLTMLELDMM